MAQVANFVRLLLLAAKWLPLLVRLLPAAVALFQAIEQAIKLQPAPSPSNVIPIVPPAPVPSVRRRVLDVIVHEFVDIMKRHGHANSP